MRKISTIWALLASLAFAPGLRAQYQWHVVHPARIDTFYYSFTSLSCAGESCSALAQVWGYDPSKPFQQMPDSNFILTSTDGGLSWATIPPAIPHWANGNGLVYEAIDQIDSLDAVVVGAHATVLRTFDDWNSWRADTGLHPPVRGSQTLNLGLAYLNFASAAEGAVLDNAEGYSLSTVDTGKHWIEKQFAGNWHSYGDSMFRSSIWPDTIVTTMDDWNVLDTTLMTLDGPFTDQTVTPLSLDFGLGDTLYFVGYRTDANSQRSVMVARSSDLGTHWSELPLPLNNGIDPVSGVHSALDAQTIVFAGRDTADRIILSTDRGETWQEDTVPIAGGNGYSWIRAVAVTGSGRLIAALTTDFEGSQVLAYLEKTSSSVAPAGLVSQPLRVYPNPATGILNIESAGTRIAVFDPLGRSYAVRREGSSLDISTMPPGVYFISDGHSRTRFVKE